MPEQTIPKPFRSLTPEQRKAILDNWGRYEALVAVHTSRFVWINHGTGKINIEMNKIGAVAAVQLITELRWKAALESEANQPLDDADTGAVTE